MMKIPFSQTTRRRALDALESLETEKVLELVRVARVQPFYEKAIGQAIHADELKAREWMRAPDISIIPERERRSGASPVQKLASMLARYEGVEVPRAGRPGGHSMGGSLKGAPGAGLTLGSAKAQGDTLHVEMPRLTGQQKAKEALDEVFSPAGDVSSEGDGGTGGYGF
jgi:hypothetical protein